MRLLIVDDYKPIRDALRVLLSTELDIEVCGEAVDGIDAIKKAQELRPDAITMDISMPHLNGLEATREILRLLPNIRIIIFSQHDSAQMRHQATQAGAFGYLLKSASPRDLAALLQQPVSTTAADQPSSGVGCRTRLDPPAVTGNRIQDRLTC